MDGSLAVSRVAPGRGAWLCRDPRTGGAVVSCLESAVRRKAFSRAFRAEVPDGAQAMLRATRPERENIEESSGGRPLNVTESTEKGLTQ